MRIPKDAETLELLQIKGLYPCGEGAGYARGIISAAVGGEKCALKIGEILKKNMKYYMSKLLLVLALVK